MTLRNMITMSLFLCMIVLAACGSDTTSNLPTLRPTVDAGGNQVTATPELGSGFDPNLGNDDATTELEPTPTRESGVVGDGDTESGARGAGFAVQISNGSMDAFNDGGQYDCTLTGHRIASGVNAAPNLTFTIPVENPVRTHSFIGADANGTASAIVSLASVDDTYTQVTGGMLIVDEAPTDAGEFVSGTFDFTIRDASGSEIGVQGTFDFETTGTAYCS
jgi:hypothetical protein